MRSRSVAVAITLSVLSAAGAGLCYWQASRLRSEAEWQLARGNAQAQEYAATFDGAAAERQLANYDARRELLARAHLWQRFQLLLILVAVVSALGSYVLYLLARLRQQLVEASDEELPQLKG
jgi:hypothetical protein